MDDRQWERISHESLKDLGNNAFFDGQYQTALLYYIHAIKKQPGISSYYSNRALCFVQLQDFPEALSDCKKSIELDETNLKAHFFAGQAHMGLNQWDEAITHLIHAQSLALEQHRNFADDITSVIRLAKRKRFEALDAKRKQEEIALQTYVVDLIRRDTDAKKCSLLSAIKGTLGVAMNIEDTSKQTNSNDTDQISPLHDSTVHVHQMEFDVPDYQKCTDIPTDVRAQLTNLEEITEKRINELNDLFTKVDQRRQKRDVPEYLCGRISFELMTDPVITPSGITYDRRTIISHLRKVGHFDPLTRRPLTEYQLIPNFAMKDVINAFLEENPWAETY